MRTSRIFLTVALALPLFAAALPAAAQYGSDEKQQTFDYIPAGERTPQLPKEMAPADSEDMQTINDPVRGIFMVSKSRWKNWVARAVYIMMMDLALIFILLSLPKNEEYALIIAYIISGAGATLSFWVFLCAWLLFLLNSSAWLLILPLSLAMAAVTYIILMNIKRLDVSLTELRESFRKTSGHSNDDPRLASITGQPGDWPNQDLIR